MPGPSPMPNPGHLDVGTRSLGGLERETGWRIHRLGLTTSTMDDAARLRRGGAGPRTAVVAEEQRQGRGREGRVFASPPGGLYASLLVGAGPLDVPGPLVAASALAVAEAVEQVAGVSAAIKWPNDVWIGRRKVAGLLLESAGGERPVVVVGIGINVREVPADLPPDVRLGVTALEPEAGRPVPLDRLLVAVLANVDRRLADLGSPAARAALGRAWSARLALKGERVTWTEGGSVHGGVFLDGGLEEGLEVVEDGRGRRRLRGEHVQDLRLLRP